MTQVSRSAERLDSALSIPEVLSLVIMGRYVIPPLWHTD